MARTAFVSLVAGLLLGFVGDAYAETRAPAHALARGGVAAAEREKLLSGRTVSRPHRFARGEDGFYVGGVSYQVVRAAPREVLQALADVRSLPQALPHTVSPAQQLCPPQLP